MGKLPDGVSCLAIETLTYFISGGLTRSEKHHGSSNCPITSPYSFTSVFRKDLHANNSFVLFTVLFTVKKAFLPNERIQQVTRYVGDQ